MSQDDIKKRLYMKKKTTKNEEEMEPKKEAATEDEGMEEHMKKGSGHAILIAIGKAVNSPGSKPKKDSNFNTTEHEHTDTEDTAESNKKHLGEKFKFKPGKSTKR